MRLMTLLFLTLTIGMSCGDDDVQKTGNCMTAVINGQEFTAETTVATFIVANIEYENLGNQESRLLTIIGTIPDLASDTKTITLSFGCAEFTSDLDYQDSDIDCGIGMDYQVSNFLNPISSLAITTTAGSINVEEVTADKIRGTFTFEGEDQNGTMYSIVDGFFDTTIE